MNAGQGGMEEEQAVWGHQGGGLGGLSGAMGGVMGSLGAGEGRDVRWEEL